MEKNAKKNILHIGSKKLSNENWKVYHPNGKHMFTCGKKKASWYIEKGLANIINEDSIKFKFTPKGEGFDVNEVFGRTSRKTICVVTGKNNDLQRHHVVPYSYRQYLPEKFKSKNHHDVVLINHDVHIAYEEEALKYKNYLAEKYQVKTIKEYNSEYSKELRKFSSDYTMLLGAIHSILKSYGNKHKTKPISNAKKEELLNLISEKTELDLDFVKSLSYLSLYKIYNFKSKEYSINLKKFKKENKQKYDHSYHLVKKLDSDEKIEEFIKSWRTHFVETMKPKHIPLGWSINFRTITEI